MYWILDPYCTQHNKAVPSVELTYFKYHKEVAMICRCHHSFETKPYQIHPKNKNQEIYSDIKFESIPISLGSSPDNELMLRPLEQTNWTWLGKRNKNCDQTLFASKNSQTMLTGTATALDCQWMERRDLSKHFCPNSCTKDQRSN